jgi:hypothetical protein
MSTTTTSSDGDVAAWIGHRHETDVLRILAELRRERRVVDAVIAVAFDLAVERGETTQQARSDFEDWSRRVVTAARRGEEALTAAPWSESLATVLHGYLSIADSADEADTTVATVVDGIAEVDAQAGGSLSGAERQIAHLVAGVLVGTVSMWSADGGTLRKSGDGIDGSQIARADAMGAITGAAGAAVATWWSGPVSGAAVAGATAAGAMLGSVVDAVMQDTANDAVEDAEPEEPAGP